MTSQMTKDFSLKSKLRKFADGGGLQRRPFEPVVGTNSPLPSGGGGGLSREAVAAAQPRLQPQAQPAIQPKSGVGALPADYLRKPASALRAREQTAGLADGGSKTPSFLERARQALGGRSRQIEGAVDAASGAPAPRPAPAPAPQPAPRPVNPDATPENPAGIKFADGGDMDEAAMLALANGGKVKGKGGPTDDEVGPVLLSDEEYVIPADTADAIGRDKLDALRLATHDFKDPEKESALRKSAVGLRDGGSTFYTDARGTTTTPAGVSNAARLPPPQAPMPSGPSINVGADGTARMAPPPGANVPAVQQAPMRQGPPIDVTPKTTPMAERVVPGANAAAANGVTDVTAKVAKSPLAKVGGLAKGFFKGGLPIGQVIGAYGAAKDAGNGYRDNFQAQMGVEGPWESAGADLLRTGAAMADGALMGIPGRIGRGIAEVVGSGEDAFAAGGVGGALSAMGRNAGRFATGVMSDSDRDTFLENKNVEDVKALQAKTLGASTGAPAAAPSPKEAAEAKALAYQRGQLNKLGVYDGVQDSDPAATRAQMPKYMETGGAKEYQNLGDFGGNANIYGKASDPSRPGRINDFVGVGKGASKENEHNGAGWVGGTSASTHASNNYGSDGNLAMSPLRAAPPRSNAAEINKNYDAMLRGGSGKTVNGLSWAQRHGAGIERDRQSALREDAQNQTSLRGQDITADTSRANNAAMNETSRINAQGTRDAARLSAQSAAADRALTRQTAAETRADAREDKGYGQFKDAITAQFTGPDGVDAVGANEFTNFVGSGEAKTDDGRPFLSLGAQERMALMPKFIEDFKLNQKFNETAKRGSIFSDGTGGTSNSPGSVEVRDSEIGDIWSHNLPATDWLKTKFGDGRVGINSNGQAARYKDLVPENDVERKRAILRNAANGK